VGALLVSIPLVADERPPVSKTAVGDAYSENCPGSVEKQELITDPPRLGCNGVVET